jgi:uncharacterized membrane protein SpoIIM required for sporulation
MSAAQPGSRWLLARAPVWRALAAAAPRLRRGRLSIDEAEQALDGYQSLARDLASARQQLPGNSVTLALESLYTSYHAALSRAPFRAGASLLQLFRSEIPEIVASLRTHLLWIVLLLALSAGAGWLLIATYPELVGLVASREQIDHVEHGELWTENLLNIAPSSILSVRILSNNVMVSVFAVCAGVLYGLGTAYLIALNGLMLGAMFAFTHQHGLDGELLRFVVAHGTVELSVICLAGAAGIALGESLIRPTLATRRESFQHCAGRVGKLLVPCALLLVGCGLIEGYVSPNPAVPFAARLAIGSAYFLFMLALLSGRLFGRGRR